jgi:hypothetical protein
MLIIYGILALVVLGVGAALFSNPNSQPFVVIALILLLVGIVFPPAWFVAGVCLIIAVFRLFF